MRRTLLIFSILFYLINAPGENIMCHTIFPHKKMTHSSVSSEFNEFINELAKSNFLTIRERNFWQLKMKEQQGSLLLKINDPEFQAYFDLWNNYRSALLRFTRQISEMPKKEKKVWMKKLEAPIHFSTQHYLTFLEQKNSNFNYNRLLGLLNIVPNSFNTTLELPHFVYLFEKQLRLFSSELEFKKCR